MRLRVLYLALIALSAAAFVQGTRSGWDAIWVFRSYRYELTVTFDVDGQTRSGSTVVQMDSWKNDAGFRLLPQFPIWVLHPICEALYIKLGDRPGDNLFVLVPVVAKQLDVEALGVNGARAFFDARIKRDRNALVEIAAKTYELSGPFGPMVRFGDVHDATSLELVDFARLSEIYKKRVSFVGASWRITDKPPTSAIRTILPWLDRFKDGDIGGQPRVERTSRGGLFRFTNYYNFVCLP